MRFSIEVFSSNLLALDFTYIVTHKEKQASRQTNRPDQAHFDKNFVIKMTINKQKHKFEVILEKVLSCPPTSNASAMFCDSWSISSMTTSVEHSGAQ